MEAMQTLHVLIQSRLECDADDQIEHLPMGPHPGGSEAFDESRMYS